MCPQTGGRVRRRQRSKYSARTWRRVYRDVFSAPILTLLDSGPHRDWGLPRKPAYRYRSVKTSEISTRFVGSGADRPALGRCGTAGMCSAAREQEHEVGKRHETHGSTDGMKATPAFQQRSAFRRVEIQGAVE